MSKRKQIAISIVLVAVSAAAVAAYSLTQGPANAPSAAGHNHGTMVAGDDAARPVSLDPESARRIGVTYATATIRPFRRTVSTVGNVAYDETRLANVNPKIEGWVERLYVDFTGAPISKGQPLLSIYSPMLVSAQEELILASRLVQNAAGSESTRSSRNAQELLESARRRLRYWDIPEEQIARIEESGTPQKTLTLMAPASGIVIEKSVVEGARVMPGMDLYRIADLSRVWIEGEVFEKDLSLVRLGQTALVTFEAYPGETFSGTVTYVYPTVSIEGRTGRIRVELSNAGLRLKPGMYAKLELEAAAARPALMIPRSAVHFTGERALVFLRGADGTLMHREITTGLIAGSDIEVLAGLAEGDVVVSSANFLIDAESSMGSSMESGGSEETAPDQASQDTAAADPHAAHQTKAPAAKSPGHTGH